MPVVYEDDPAVTACLDRSQRSRERCTPARHRLATIDRCCLERVLVMRDAAEQDRVGRARCALSSRG
jgi:hypothetical protein